MANVLNLYSELLLKRHPLNPTFFFDADDKERLTLYDGDIAARIDYEASIIQKEIDIYYHAHSKKDNKQYFKDLLFEINRLIKESERILRNLKISLLSTPAPEKNYYSYANVHSIYKNLFNIRFIIYDSYNLKFLQEGKDEIKKMKLQYPALSVEDVYLWRNEYIQNLEEGKTKFIIDNVEIIIEEEYIDSALRAVMENAQYSAKDIVEHRSKQFIEVEKDKDNLNGQNGIVQNDKPVQGNKQEYIEFKGSVELLGLFVRLLFESDLINSDKSKAKVSRVLSQCIKTANGNFKPDTLLKRYDNNNFLYSDNNIKLMKDKLRKMLAYLREL